jgi:DNA-directed RNA polymerase specialized sigma24 family protein
LAVSESSAHQYQLQDPDVRLMLKVRDDNAAAFDELMLRYQNRLVTVLEHLVGRRDLAEDLAQEVFLRVYRARKRYVPGAKFSTWLYTIANHVASNALRSMSGRAARNRTHRPLGPRRAATDGRFAQQVREHELRGHRRHDGNVAPGRQVALVPGPREPEGNPGAVLGGRHATPVTP